MLFYFQSKKMEKACQAALPVPICQHFVYAARRLVPGGGGPAGNKSLEGNFAGVEHFSPLLTKPLRCFSLHNLFQQMLGAVAEALGSVWSPRSAPRGSPIVHLSPVSVCSSAASR